MVHTPNTWKVGESDLNDTPLTVAECDRVIVLWERAGLRENNAFMARACESVAAEFRVKRAAIAKAEGK